MEAPKKTLYHSSLVQMGQVEALIKTRRQKSKYSKPNDPKPDYVVMMIDGFERQYTTENENCAAALDGLVGQTVLLTATGSRDAAAIEVVAEAGAKPAAARPAQQPAARPTQAARPAAEPAPTDEVGVKKLIGKKSHLMFLCLNAAHYACREAFIQTGEEFTPSSSDIQKVAATLYIDAHREGLHANLDYKFAGKAPMQPQ